MTLDELIDLLGGDQAVARICQIRPSAVSNWRTRGTPAHRAIQMAQAARRAGFRLCLDDLPPPPPASRGRAGKARAPAE